MDEKQKADYRKEGFLNEKCKQLIFQKKKQFFIDLLKIHEVENFFNLFDVDKVMKPFVFLIQFLLGFKCWLIYLMDETGMFFFFKITIEMF